MHKISLVFIITSIFTYATWYVHTYAIQKPESLLAVVIMVKNEEHAIKDTLQPFVAAGVQHFLVFDTGSTDDTLDVVKKYFAENSMHHAHVAQEMFIDFSTSRNHALALAEKLFSDVPFLMMPDAEWHLHNANQLLDFCAQEKSSPHAAYFVRIRMKKSHLCLPRLIRTTHHARFTGSVHELLEVGPCPAVPSDIFFIFYPSSRGEKATMLRAQKDLELLLHDYERDPHNTRTLFFLAQTYENLNQFEKAYHYYIMCLEHQLAVRTTAAWNSSQAYEAAYNAAANAERLMFTDNAFSWERAYELYQKASAIDPLRAEPFVRIAYYFWSINDMEQCFASCKQAAALPYPLHTVDNVDVDVYTHQCYELLGASAACLGDYETSIWAFTQAIKARPDLEVLKKHLESVLCKK